MKIALDTNAYSALQRGQAPLLKQMVSHADMICFVFVVDAELRAGFKKGQNAKDNYTKLTRFQSIDRATLIFADEQTNEMYAKVWAELAKNGTPIPTNDVWIAAICLQHQLTLATSDSHFNKVPLLQTVPGTE